MLIRILCVILGKVKLVKGSKPLIHYKFYLDIEKHNIATRIENKIKEFGGVSIRMCLINMLEVTHLILFTVVNTFYTFE